MQKTKPDLITHAPLTAEARESLLQDLFAEHMPHYGEMFIPDDSFYSTEPGQKQAKHMVAQLCRWLGIKPGYIGLTYESDPGSVPDGQRYVIFIESWVLEDEFYLGATLALALTRYLIEEKKRVRLPPSDQSALTAAASTEFGLGLVIMNGLSPVYGWADKWITKLISPSHSVMGKFPVKTYSKLVKGFIAKYRVHPATFQHVLTPWAAERLSIRASRGGSKTVNDTRHKIRYENIKLVGICWIIALVLGVGSYVLSMRVAPIAPEILQAQEELALLNSVTRDCKDALAYKRQYADSTDIQSVRNLNAENLRCKSLENQRSAAEQNYRQLTNPK